LLSQVGGTSPAGKGDNEIRLATPASRRFATRWAAVPVPFGLADMPLNFWLGVKTI
jgi:hypothetical protein